MFDVIYSWKEVVMDGFEYGPVFGIIQGLFLSLARSKLRLCLANHMAGYFSNLACDWLSIVWAYSEQETENGPRSSRCLNIRKYLSRCSIHYSGWPQLASVFPSIFKLMIITRILNLMVINDLFCIQHTKIRSHAIHISKYMPFDS